MYTGTVFKKKKAKKQGNTQTKRQASRKRVLKKPTHGSVDANSIGVEAGIFLRASFQGIDVWLLVDTVVTLTFVSTAVVEIIAEKCMTILGPMPKNIYDAGDKELNVSHKGTFELKVGSFSCTVKAAVVDIMVDGIMGLDFLTVQLCCRHAKARNYYWGP